MGEQDGSRMVSIASSIHNAFNLLMPKKSPENIKCICQSLKVWFTYTLCHRTKFGNNRIIWFASVSISIYSSAATNLILICRKKRTISSISCVAWTTLTCQLNGYWLLSLSYVRIDGDARSNHQVCINRSQWTLVDLLIHFICDVQQHP